ncbi:MAG: hypothetical protein KJ674_04620 [Nanoarchaeota archaeon]|nr:hypothetical protein [Nanoarchaeota archaeon]
MDVKYFEKEGKGYKIDSDGEKYRISFSEELQLKNLKSSKENKKWLMLNFYAKVSLALILLVLTVTFLFLLYRLDAVNFFSGILYR